MTFPVFLLNRSKLPICSYIIFFFWPVTLQALNGSSTVLVSTQQVSPMTFLPFLLNRSRLPICSYIIFFFWPVTLESVKKKRIYACILIKKKNLKKKKKNIYACILMKKISKKKKKKYLCMYIDE